MDETYSESDVSLSPSQILERLQVLRQLQLMQRGKLQKQRLQYKETSETSSSITEIVSHFSNSTSYNTFRSLLQSSTDISNEGTPRVNSNDLAHKVQEKDLIEGVSVLNLSQESELMVSPTISSRSASASVQTRSQELVKGINESQTNDLSLHNNNNISSNSPSYKNNVNTSVKKQISLEEMPILSPKRDFEALIIEKLKHEVNKPIVKSPQQKETKNTVNKRPFLRRGEGIARFGLKKKDFVIQKTTALPWKKKGVQTKNTESPLKLNIKELKAQNKNKQKDKSNEIDNKKRDLSSDKNKNIEKNTKFESQSSEPSMLLTDLKQATLTRKTQPKQKFSIEKTEHKLNVNDNKQPLPDHGSPNGCHMEPILKPMHQVETKSNKHPLVVNKGKTWAAVLTKEQNDFLSQLKQSEYYKNFTSPTKSVASDASCDESMIKLRQERENAEQNMFELLENKVTHESFNLENSFYNRFLRRNLEYSGESTPLVMQRCLSENPELMHIFPGLNGKKRNENSQSDAESCSCADCCSEVGSSVSCCSCKTVDETKHPVPDKNTKKKSSDQKSKPQIKSKKEVENNESQDNTLTENDVIKANMVEMNAKLIATSELLKDRLNELEDEIETFRNENSNLAKLREEVDRDKQKFYEEKAAFEQKFNEEKVLAEYYLAEEKEKLNKQKQMYERYVREMRGRLNKKEKDEVVNLKKEINDLKDEIRLKDAKSTSTIARLRNQIKIMEKEKKDLQEEVEKLKKQNRRIQHSNEITRRMTNIKYLEEINKKLTNMSTKDSRSEVSTDPDIKYKAYEIERQSRIRKVVPTAKGTMRPRAKSVPNLKVTSRYAKYFSQRDTMSHTDHDTLANVERYQNSDEENFDAASDIVSNESLNGGNAENEANNLEKIYMERFRSTSPKSNRSSGSNSNFEYGLTAKPDLNENTKGFFIQKSSSGSSRNSKSPRRTISPCLTAETNMNRSKSPVSILSNKSKDKSPISHTSVDYVPSHSSSNSSRNKSKSPVSSYNNSSLKSLTVIHNEQYRDKLMSLSPEPSVSKTSFTKTSLNPTEYRKPDGSRELRFPNGNVKIISADGKYSKFVYYNGDVKENFYSEGRIKYYYAETKTFHTTHADGLEVLEFPDGQVEKRYKDGSSEIRLPNGSVRYFDPKNEHVREEWRFPDGAALTVAASGEQRIVFSNGQIEVHAKDHKRREFPDGTVKLVYNDGTSETRYSSGRVRIKDKHGNLIMDSASG
ncbi:centromere protein J [Trichoplusia ni]|uniref:Centromere protein J n=1 Tax=Trichoplusia ni TaxID=7111 RepID=A0A7E5WL10_TRINI|nr:centromere protein J [Trichoplusia ni]